MYWSTADLNHRRPPVAGPRVNRPNLLPPATRRLNDDDLRRIHWRRCVHRRAIYRRAVVAAAMLFGKGAADDGTGDHTGNEVTQFVVCSCRRGGRQCADKEQGSGGRKELLHVSLQDVVLLRKEKRFYPRNYVTFFIKKQIGEDN